MAGPAYQWGHWRFEPSECRLLRDGVAVALPGKTLDLLSTLLRRAPRLVAKEEILAAVWADTMVEEGNIAFHVAALRKVLDEDEGSSAIETVRGKGYRFISELTIHQLPPTDALRKDAVERAIGDAGLAPPKRRWWPIAVLAVILVGGLGVFTSMRSRPEPISLGVHQFVIVSPPPGQENFPDGLSSYLTTKFELAGVTIHPVASATVLLSGQLHPLDGGFRVTIQLTRRSDDARVWDWSFDLSADVEKPREGEDDDARSRLQGVIATHAVEGVRSYLNLSADVLVTR